ncbi:MAG: hypothetical protein ACI85O_002773 [Saprospiraceae bacterium]|jgi:hypothetical protein
MKDLLFLLLLGSFFTSCSNTENPALQQEITNLKNQITEMKSVTETPKARFVHVVYFWLKEDLTPEQTTNFYAGVKTLGEIKDVINFRLGKAAGTPRDVVDNTYDAMIIVECADAEGHEAYQVDAIHDKFREDCGTFFEKIQIYDSLME